MKSVLIFGHAGFSGLYMTRYLLGMQGITLTGIDQRKTGLMEEYQEDLVHFDRTDRIIGRVRPDYIINLAGLNQAEDPAHLYAANVLPVIHAIRSLHSHALSHTRLLTISSAAVYGDAGKNPVREENPVKPVNMYGASKLAMEQLLPVMSRSFSCHAMVARTFNLVGPGLPENLSIPSFIKQLIRIRNGETAAVIRVGNLEPRRDYVDINDAVKAYWKIVTEGIPGETYNVGSGKSHSMKEILDMIIREAGIVVSTETDHTRVRKVEIMSSLADISKISALGWFPEIEFIQSLKAMLEYYQRNN